MASKTERTVVALGGSRVIALPHDWCEGSDVHPGDKLVVLYDETVTIKKKASAHNDGEAQ